MFASYFKERVRERKHEDRVEIPAPGFHALVRAAANTIDFEKFAADYVRVNSDLMGLVGDDVAGLKHHWVAEGMLTGRRLFAPGSRSHSIFLSTKQAQDIIEKIEVLRPGSALHRALSEPFDDLLIMQDVRAFDDAGERVALANLEKCLSYDLGRASYLRLRAILPFTVDIDASYCAVNPDVSIAIRSGHLTARQHYVAFGYDEERVPFAINCNVPAYIAANSDLYRAHRDGSLKDLARHFDTYAAREGRVCIANTAPGCIRLDAQAIDVHRSDPWPAYTSQVRMA